MDLVYLTQGVTETIAQIIIVQILDMIVFCPCYLIYAIDAIIHWYHFIDAHIAWLYSIEIFPCTYWYLH